MTVRELIEALEKLDGAIPVFTLDECGDDYEEVVVREMTSLWSVSKQQHVRGVLIS